MMSKMGFCRLWLRVIWKLRSVYCALVVHVFDVLTDILVIISWLSYPDISGDNVDPRAMAYSALGVLGIHKLVSFIAFWAKERSVVRCVLQVLDVLIFEEIYLTHNKIITQFRMRANKDRYEKEKREAIETTSTFKYIRNLEAVFESIPQSVLQLVFIIRTGWKSEDQDGSGVFLIISIASIVQSIISMTNSILNNDNIYMTLPRWKDHKQRLPPTWPFIKHAISRLSEVVYRICLCALFWIVCGGLPFSILIGVEFIYLLIIVVVFDIVSGDGLSSIDDFFLRIQMLIIMPSELVYALDDTSSGVWNFGNDEAADMFCACIGTICGPFLCCIGPATFLSTLCCQRKEFYMHMSARIGISMTEWITIMIWPLFIDTDSWDFLYSADYGLYVFLISGACYLIYSQYLYLFPQFQLPFDIPIQSMYGYAFTGELEELQRVKPSRYRFKWDDDNPQRSALPNIKLRGADNKTVKKLLYAAFYGRLEILQKMYQRSLDLIAQDELEISTIQTSLEEYRVEEGALKQRWNQGRLRASEYEQLMNVLNSKYGPQHLGSRLDQLQRRAGYLQILKVSCWDVCILSSGRYRLGQDRPHPWITPALLALSNKQYHVLEWLEGTMKATNHWDMITRQKRNGNVDDENDYLLARKHLNISSPWSAPYRNTEHGTCLMLALSNEKYHIVEWLLKEKNVLIPADFTMDHEFGKAMIGKKYFEVDYDDDEKNDEEDNGDVDNNEFKMEIISL